MSLLARRMQHESGSYTDHRDSFAEPPQMKTAWLPPRASSENRFSTKMFFPRVATARMSSAAAAGAIGGWEYGTQLNN
jgi:hypothetical protein